MLSITTLCWCVFKSVPFLAFADGGLWQNCADTTFLGHDSVSVCLLVGGTDGRPVCMRVCLSVCVCMYVCLSVCLCLSGQKLSNEVSFLLDICL